MRDCPHIIRHRGNVGRGQLCPTVGRHSASVVLRLWYTAPDRLDDRFDASCSPILHLPFVRSGTHFCTSAVGGRDTLHTSLRCRTRPWNMRLPSATWSGDLPYRYRRQWTHARIRMNALWRKRAGGCRSEPGGRRSWRGCNSNVFVPATKCDARWRPPDRPRYGVPSGATAPGPVDGYCSAGLFVAQRSCPRRRRFNGLRLPCRQWLKHQHSPPCAGARFHEPWNADEGAVFAGGRELAASQISMSLGAQCAGKSATALFRRTDTHRLFRHRHRRCQHEFSGRQYISIPASRTGVGSNWTNLGWLKGALHQV